MNEQNYRWLRTYLLELDPRKFDYMRAFTGGDCGCVSYHVVWHADEQRAAKGSSTNGIDLMEFLGINGEQAGRLWIGALADGTNCDTPVDDFEGEVGIRRAVQCLDEIAVAYGLSPDPDQHSVSASVWKAHTAAGTQASTCCRPLSAGQPTEERAVAGVESGTRSQNPAFTEAERAFLATLRAECELSASGSK